MADVLVTTEVIKNISDGDYPIPVTKPETILSGVTAHVVGQVFAKVAGKLVKYVVPVAVVDEVLAAGVGLTALPAMAVAHPNIIPGTCVLKWTDAGGAKSLSGLYDYSPFIASVLGSMDIDYEQGTIEAKFTTVLAAGDITLSYSYAPTGIGFAKAYCVACLPGDASGADLLQPMLQQANLKGSKLTPDISADTYAKYCLTERGFLIG